MTPEEKDMVVLKAFVMFLKANNALIPFRVNYYRDSPGYRGKFFPLYNEYMHIYNEPISYLAAAFTWANTKEGCKFWNRLHHKWTRTLRLLEYKDYKITPSLFDEE